jgi:hypothetical protein
MPYRHAHWYVLALFPLSALAFWPNYLSQFMAAPMQFHVHGITASLWLVLIAAQSWTIHHDRRALHRAIGPLSLIAFPLFLVGGVGIFMGMAQRFVEGASPFYTMYAARLSWLDFVGVGGVSYFFYEAMRQRRKVHPHARYLLATTIFLLPPILGRLMAIPLGVTGPEDFAKLGTGFQIANALTALIAFALAVHSGKHGRPFWLAGVLTIVAALLYQFVGGLPAWEQLFARAAGLPLMPMAALAAAAGVAVSYAGWTAGRRPTAPIGALPA